MGQVHHDGRQTRRVEATPRTPARGTAVPAPTREPSAQAVLQHAVQEHGALTAHDVLHLQRTIGNQAVGQVLAALSQRRDNPVAIGAEAATRPAAAVDPVMQRLAFTRFEGFSRLFNWSYSTREHDLLTLEKRVVDAYTDLERYVQTRRPGEPVLASMGQIKTALDGITQGHHAERDYGRVQAELYNLLQRIDALSIKQAKRDRLEATFAAASSETAPAPRQLITRVHELTAQQRIVDLPDLREHMDFLSQWASDALLKSPPRSVDVYLKLKTEIGKATLDIHTAYLLATVNGDDARAESYMVRGCLRLRSLDMSPLVDSPAVPKAREDWKEGFDPGALMIAAALRDDHFIPDMVVGLPTGGVHAANRLAAALSILTGSTPILWYTRPRGVKPSSKELMSGVGQEEFFRAEELAHLSQRVASTIGDRRTLRIVIVDDGVTTGETMKMGRALYEAAFRAMGLEVQVKTATVKGGTATEFERVEYKKAYYDNPVDYVMNQVADRAGPRGAMFDQPALFERHQRRDPGLTSKPGVTLSTTVEIYHAHGAPGSREVKLANILKPPQ